MDVVLKRTGKTPSPLLFPVESSASSRERREMVTIMENYVDNNNTKKDTVLVHLENLPPSCRDTLMLFKRVNNLQMVSLRSFL